MDLHTRSSFPCILPPLIACTTVGTSYHKYYFTIRVTVEHARPSRSGGYRSGGGGGYDRGRRDYGGRSGGGGGGFTFRDK